MPPHLHIRARPAMRGLLLVTCASLVSSEPTWAGSELADVSSDGGLCLLQDSASAVRRSQIAPGAQFKTGSGGAPVACEEGHGSEAFLSSLDSAYFWPNKNGDATCTGASKVASPFNVSVGPAWSFKDAGASPVRAQPCIDDDMNIYLSHINGKLRKFTPGGELLWTNSVNDGFNTSVPAGPLLMDGAIFTATDSGYVACIDMASGRTLWREKVASGAGIDTWSLVGRSGIVLASMLAGDDKASPFGGNSQIIAMDARDGQVLWRWDVPGEEYLYNWIGAFVDGPPSVVFATTQGRPYRLRLCDGATLWAGPDVESGQPFLCTGGLVVAPHGLAYASSNVIDDTGLHGVLSAFNVSTGDVVWRRNLTMIANSAPSVGKLRSGGDLSVVVGMGDQPLIQIPFADATGRWPNGQPVAFLSEVTAFDAATGEPTGWRYAPPPHRKTGAEGDNDLGRLCMPDPWSNGAIDGHGTYYVGHMSGNLFAIRDHDGDGRIDEEVGEVAKYYDGRCYQGSPGLAPGMLVATPCDGMHVFKARD